MADFTNKELKQYSEVDEDFTPDISEEESMQMINEARGAISFNKNREVIIAKLLKANDRPEKKWQLIYDWLMKTNPAARKDVNAVIKECKDLRESRANKYARADAIGMRYGMRIPAIVLNSITLVDPRIREMEILSPEDAKKVYRQIEEVFPQFKIPRQD